MNRNKDTNKKEKIKEQEKVARSVTSKAELKDVEIVRGVPLNKESGNQANGSGCLAAQMVKHFKEEIGYIYLHPHDNESGWEDYIYTVYPKTGEETFISIYDVHNERCIFVGTASQLIKKYKVKTNQS